MPPPENERRIFDDLVRWADGSIKAIYDIWKRKRSIDAFFLSWPAVPVKTHDGGMLDDICRLELPQDKGEWPGLFRDAVRLTKPFAILLCEQREQDVRLIIESEYGTRSWTLPIQRRGDIVILGKADVKTDVENIGLLWSSKMAQA